MTELRRAAERLAISGINGEELHTAFCAATVYCEARDEGPAFVARGEPPVIPVFSSLERLAKFTGQTSWFSTSGQDLLDLLPDGYDLVIDPGSRHAVRLSAEATRRTSTITMWRSHGSG